MQDDDLSCGARANISEHPDVTDPSGRASDQPGRVRRQGAAQGMKRHKGKERSTTWDKDLSCIGCKWYHEWFGVCCNGESEYRGDVSERCGLYDDTGEKEGAEFTE